MRKVIIDTDPGIDDAAAIAILLNEPSINVELISCVAGNVGIEHTTNNALRLLNFLQKDIPVAKGAATPLLRENRFATNAHGASGMGSFEFPEPKTALLTEENAVLKQWQILQAAKEPVTIIALGPLTNVALLLQTFPEIRSKIQEIVLMGGSTARGNIGVYGEFNVMIDPEAAKIVFRSGVPITMVGLDIGRKARLLAEDLDALETHPVGKMLADLFRSYDGGDISEGVKMYDPSAALYLLNPELFQTQLAFVDVEISSPLTLGATVVDFDGVFEQADNATICVDVDVEAFRQKYLERVLVIREEVANGTRSSK